MAMPRRLIKLIAWFAAAAVFFSAGAVVLLRFVPPPASAFMAARYIEGLLDEKRRKEIEYRWVDMADISPHMALAAVAAEDQRFPRHWGFDLREIREALDGMGNGHPRGASTISQQTVKNLFLWNGRSYFRKGLEACLTVLVEACWPKRRILEVYLNVAEFGDGIYGVDAAARKFFRKPPSRLTKEESALLAAVLPNPKRYRAAAPSAYVRGRAARIAKQMRNLGDAYLRPLSR